MSLNKLPLLGTIIGKIDQDIGKKGIQKSMDLVMKRTGTKIILGEKSENLINVLKNEAVIIVASHPQEAGIPAFLAAIESRKNMNLIIESSLMNVFPSANKYLIPVYINNRQLAQNKFHLKLKLLKLIHKTEDFTYEDEHQKNIESINLAGKKINKGNMIVIFPDGGSTDGKWFSGVGHLIKKIKLKDKTYVVKAYINGTSAWDFLRIIPGISKIFPSFRIYFDEPIKMTEFKKMEAKKITANLENDYNDWIKIINQRYFDGIRNWTFPEKGWYFARTCKSWLLARSD
jgi:1-acyl-sn-glycerol-3-phosphate acyltransferase